MKCFGDKSRTYHCKVVLLDEQELIQEIQDTTTGQDLLETVFTHLNLMETAYFGLRYLDPSNQTHWLDPAKKVVKQLKGTSPFTLYFSVKFYAADPCKLVEEITRYQFFLQVKQDILQGRLPISQDLAAELGSYAVQSELGDYDPRRHSPGYVSEFRFVTNQSVPLENKIAELHKKLTGQVPSKAEMCYLEKVKWLDMYGVDLHPVLGEDNIEYFLGLTPSGVIVLRNKAKVGNYFWPRISKVYFRGRFFMLRVRDKNNSENTYGFETPSKAACKHLWQCCVEHHAFFRLTQASGNTPAAIFSLGSKFRYSGRTEKEAVQEAKLGSRTQPEFTRMPSRRYQRRIVEGAQDKAFRCWIITKAPRVEDIEVKPETRSTVQLPTPVSTVSHMYRSSASLAMGPRSDSPRSTRSAPQPMGRGRGGAPSPRSVRSAATTVPAAAATTTPTAAGQSYVSRRTSSVDSQSSVDSRGHRSRQRRGRARSSDGESEASSKCSSRCHRHRHRHRHHSDDPDNHRHRRRRHRHKSGGSMVNSEGQWAQVQAGEAQVKGSTATVRDLSHKSGYQPSGIDTEADSHHHHHHSNKKRHRKHRSRSRSPSEAKNSRLPEELRRHLDFEMQRTQGLSEAQMRQIPYTRVETAKTIKIKYTSPKTKRHKSPRRSKSNSSDRKATPPADGESPPPPYTPSPAGKTNTLPKSAHKDIPGDSGGVADGHEGGGGLVNGTLQSPDTRVSQATSRIRSPEGRASEGQRGHEEVGHNGMSCSSPIPAPVPPPVPPPPPSSSQSFGYSSPHKPIMVNGPSVKTLVTGGGGANGAPSPLCHDPQPTADTGDDGGGSGPGFPQMKSGGERGHSQFTAVLKPQSSPQSSVTSGISVGSSSVSISADSSLTTGSHHHRDTTDSHLLSSTSNSPDPDRHKRDGHSYENLLFDFQNSDCQTTCDTPEPYYSNCGSQSDTHRTQNSHPSPSPNLQPLTQHSTNILIHYHDNNDTLKSPSQLSNSQPVPLPRSSIISSVHSGDSSMHIVQSYGPSISSGDSKNNTNSLQRSGLHSATTKRASANCVGVPLFPSSMSSSPAPSNSSVNGFGSSSTLPRQMKPLMRTTGSQTNIFRTTASQTNHTNPRAASSASETTPSVHGTNLAHSALHWKVYNWDAYREEAEWSNSLGHTSKGQGTVGNQTSTAITNDNISFPSSVYNYVNTAEKSRGEMGRLLGSSSHHKMHLPLPNQGHVNGKVTGSVKTTVNRLSNGYYGGFENKNDFHDYVNGKTSGHMKTFGNGHINGFVNSHIKDYPNGSSLNDRESKNNRNVSFLCDDLPQRNSKDNNIPKNNKADKSGENGDSKKGKADEISTEL